jgi:hypothetical protein
VNKSGHAEVRGAGVVGVEGWSAMWCFRVEPSRWP